MNPGLCYGGLQLEMWHFTINSILSAVRPIQIWMVQGSFGDNRANRPARLMSIWKRYWLARFYDIEDLRDGIGGTCLWKRLPADSVYPIDDEVEFVSE